MQYSSSVHCMKKDCFGLTMLGYFIAMVLKIFKNQQAKCDINTAINGIIVIANHPQSVSPQNTLISMTTFTNYYNQYLSKLSSMVAFEYNMTLRPNEYAKVLHDLVWAAVITSNKICCVHEVNNAGMQELCYEQYNWRLTIPTSENRNQS